MSDSLGIIPKSDFEMKHQKIYLFGKKGFSFLKIFARVQARVMNKIMRLTVGQIKEKHGSSHHWREESDIIPRY